MSGAYSIGTCARAEASMEKAEVATKHSHAEKRGPDINNEPQSVRRVNGRMRTVRCFSQTVDGGRASGVLFSSVRTRFDREHCGRRCLVLCWLRYSNC